MYRGSLMSEDVTSINANHDASLPSKTTYQKSRWGRLKRSSSEDDIEPTPKNTLLADDIRKKETGRKHRSSHDCNGSTSSNHMDVVRKSTSSSWFRKQQQAANVSDNKSISDRSKKSITIGSLFSSRQQQNLNNSSSRRRDKGPSDRQQEVDVPGEFYDNYDKDCVSSFADEQDTHHSEKSALLSSQKRDEQKFSLFSKTAQKGSKIVSGMTKKGSSIPTLRKNVSFDSDTPVSNINFVDRPQSVKFDQQVVVNNIVAANNDNLMEYEKLYGSEDESNKFDNKNYGYNCIDFPIPAKNQGTMITNISNQPTIDRPPPLRENSTARERARYSVYEGNSKVKKKLRVRPYHCFPDENVMMTEEEIYAESLTKSKDFVPLKSYLVPSTRKQVDVKSIPESVRELWGTPEIDNRIGALRVEVLGCVGLNRIKPDISVYMVCGDAAFCTDVLTGYRSPMWPSVSRRACIFPIHHAYAKLFIGVFDVRKRKNKENDVFCGRVAIDIASIRPNTEYDTTMPLHASTFVYDKRKRGVIRVRFSIHWFNERAAVISYMKSVKSLIDSSPLIEGQPTIPCADPKTFRNVAVTVYGQDLPGKYSKNAFRATVRELTLYQLNLRVVCKVLVLDAMLYQEPWISLYLFFSSIYCVLYNTVAMVPAFIVGYFLIQYIENYRRFVENDTFHFGYKPLTIMEIFKALVFNNDKKSTDLFLQSISVDKKTKRRQGERGMHQKHDPNTDVDNDDVDITPMDHREFPFSDRDAYPMLSVEESLAPGSKKGGTGRMHGRLSVYYTATAPTSAENCSVDEDDSDADSDHDDETVMTESQMIGDSLFDLDSDNDEDDEMNLEGTDYNYKLAVINKTTDGAYDRRLRIGPPQDTDMSGGNKIPPQVQLKKVEALFHKFSRSISVEMVHAPPSLQLEKSDTNSKVNHSSSGMISPSRELQDKMAKKAKKLLYDDFDKLLGLQTRSANPIHRIMSSFMGPLMRVIRIAVFLTRISFNVSTWRDPYLSFWVLAMLSALCFILIIFPWRIFFFVVSICCLGPQNIFVRKYLERKLADKEKEMLEEKEKEESSPREQLSRSSSLRKNKLTDSLDTSTHVQEKISDTTIDARRGRFGKRRNNSAEGRAAASTKFSIENENPTIVRPAFHSDLHKQATVNTKIQPRAVVVPYSRFRKERFYNWPPDPTVSRATPIVLHEKDNDSLSASIPSIPMSDNDNEDELNVSLRRRHSSLVVERPSDIPSVITF